MDTPPATRPRRPALGDLVCDPDGRLSATRLWYSVGNAAMTVAFVAHALHNPLTADLLFAYGLVVAGSNAANRVIKLRYKNARPD